MQGWCSSSTVFLREDDSLESRLQCLHQTEARQVLVCDPCIRHLKLATMQALDKFIVMMVKD